MPTLAQLINPGLVGQNPIPGPQQSPITGPFAGVPQAGNATSPGFLGRLSAGLANPATVQALIAASGNLLTPGSSVGSGITTGLNTFNQAAARQQQREQQQAQNERAQRAERRDERRLDIAESTAQSQAELREAQTQKVRTESEALPQRLELQLKKAEAELAQLNKPVTSPERETIKDLARSLVKTGAATNEDEGLQLAVDMVKGRGRNDPNSPAVLEMKSILGQLNDPNFGTFLNDEEKAVEQQRLRARFEQLKAEMDNPRSGTEPVNTGANDLLNFLQNRGQGSLPPGAGVLAPGGTQAAPGQDLTPEQQRRFEAFVTKNANFADKTRLQQAALEFALTGKVTGQ